VSGFRIKFTLEGGIGLFTSPPSDNLELALRRAADLEQRYRATIQRIVGSEGRSELRLMKLALNVETVVGVEKTGSAVLVRAT
jgi:hypothetical protein